MVNAISSVTSLKTGLFQASVSTSASRGASVSNDPKDILDLGKGKALTPDQSMNVVLQSAMDKLRSVVTDARKALGIADNAPIDTSAEGTAGRIADFALGAFDKWSANHTGLATDDARKQFVSFIGGAIQEGIKQARGILSAVNALNPDVNQNIDKTWDIIQSRLKDFADNGK